MAPRTGFLLFLAVPAYSPAADALSLHNAVRMAMGSHPELRAADRNLEARRAGIGISRSPLLPGSPLKSGFSGRQPDILVHVKAQSGTIHTK